MLITKLFSWITVCCWDNGWDNGRDKGGREVVDRQARWFKLDYLEIPNVAFVAGKGTVEVDGTETLSQDATADW